MSLSFSGKQSSHQTQRKNKKLTSSGFKQQPICTPLAPTRNKTIYKTACSDGPNSGSRKPSQKPASLKRASLVHQFVDQLRKQMNHRHMFSHWEINHEKFASRVLYQLPAHYVPEATLQQNVQDRDFPSRRVRKKPPQADIDEFKAKCRELRRFATAQELSNPVSFALENSWTTTLKSDKLHFLEHTTLRMT